MKIKINKKEFLFFNDLNINMKLDSVASTFSLNARFDPENEEHKKLLMPGSYHTVQIFDNEDVLLFTGTILNTEFVSSSKPSLVSVSGYSLAGILEDCNIPVSAYPLESINRSIRDIVTRLLNVFKLGLVIQNTNVITRQTNQEVTLSVDVPVINSFEQSLEGSNIGGQSGQLVTTQNVTTTLNEVDVVIPKSTADATESIKSYIAKLCSQKNILLSHNQRGDLVLFKPNLGRVVYSFNKQNTLNMGLSFNGQGLHSDISVIRQPSKKNTTTSTVDSVKNPIIRLFRPKIKTLSSGEDTDTKNAANNELASELKSIGLKINVDRTIGLLPGQIVDVENPEVFLYQKTKFMVKDINIKETVNSETMEITLVLPETYTSGTPKNIFL